METFSDKPLFNLKQFISGIIIAITIGGGIARFEFKTSSMTTKIDAVNAKLDLLIVAVAKDRVDNENKFKEINDRILANETTIRAVTTSLTALIKPEEITIKRR